MLGTVIACLDDPDNSVRGSALITLRLIGPPVASALPRVREMVTEDPSSLNRTEAEYTRLVLEHLDEDDWESGRTRRCP